VSKASLTK